MPTQAWNLILYVTIIFIRNIIVVLYNAYYAHVILISNTTL